MMDISKFLGIYTIIPATLLLTVSFFVLVVLRKIEVRSLKVFGYAITGLLCIAAALVFSMGVYVMATGRHPVITMMKSMMCPSMMPGMQHKMASGHMGKHMMGQQMMKQQDMECQQKPQGQQEQETKGK